MRRLAGCAGLAYVAFAGIENMQVLERPAIGDVGRADVEAAYADQALAAVTSLAGAVSLAAFALFAVAFARFLEPAPPWTQATGLAAAGLAFAGVVVQAPLVFDPGHDDAVTLYELQQVLRLLSGPLAAGFLARVCVGGADVMPLGLRLGGLAVTGPLLLGPIAAAFQARWLVVLVGIGFSLQALWVLLTSLWLLYGDAKPAVLIQRSAFLVLVGAAGLVGLALLAVPGATGSFFSWGLEPEPLAAFAGGVYVGSAALYALSLARPPDEARGLVVGAAVLSVSVLVVTLGHLDVFDFDRLQAWVWLALFALFSAVSVWLVAAGPRASASPPLPAPLRAVLALVALGLGAVAAALWIDPEALEAPFPLPPLGGRFAGSWVALVAVLCAWAAARNSASDGRWAGVGLVALPAGALAAAARTAPDLDHGLAYALVLAALVTTGAVILAARPGSAPPPTSHRPSGS
jgi:hypothetical protein